MAVRAALCSFITDPDFKENDERSKAAKEQVKKFLQIITEDDSRQNRFDILVVKRLEKCFFSCVSTEGCRSKLVKREKTLRAFQRVGELVVTYMYMENMKFQSNVMDCICIIKIPCHSNVHLQYDKNSILGIPRSFCFPNMSLLLVLHCLHSCHAQVLMLLNPAPAVRQCSNKIDVLWGYHSVLQLPFVFQKERLLWGLDRVSPIEHIAPLVQIVEIVSSPQKS